ncbi:MAG: SBBP repeat-containing protein [Anaerolineae bacterium]|nr:SBBP repeat-containing protein [Anaerolineae bacterium]
MVYSTFLGSSKYDSGEAIAVDDAGRAYVTGHTVSTGFPTTPGAFIHAYQGEVDAFVAKLGGRGDALLYATFLGGREYDRGYGIAVDAYGRAYVTGETWSDDFPTTDHAFSRSYHGHRDAFVVKLGAQGDALFYGTFLGGDDNDWGNDIAVDASGDAFVVGSTDSADFPVTAGALDRTESKRDAFVLKLNPQGSGLSYSTYFGGTELEEGNGIAIDQAGYAYIVGITYSTDLQTEHAFDSTYHGNGDVFVAKLSPSGTGLSYATYLGGSGRDTGLDVAVALGRAYVVGGTNSNDFPRLYPLQIYQGDDDAFVTVLNAQGNTLFWSSYLGGSNSDWGYGIAVDGSLFMDVVGGTRSADFPVTSGALDETYNGLRDAFVVRILPNAAKIAYATYLGAHANGSLGDSGLAVAAGSQNDIYVTGATDGSDFPTTAGAYDTSLNGYVDAFVTRLDVIPPVVEHVQASHDEIFRFGCPLSPISSVVRADVTDARLDDVALYYRTSLDFFHWYRIPMSLESGNTYKATLAAFFPGSIDYYVKALDSAGNVTASDTRTITVKGCRMTYMPMVLR